MASRATTLVPPHHQPTKGTLIFTYTFVGLTGTAIIVVLIVFCRYGGRGRARVITAASTAESNQRDSGPVGADIARLPEAFSYTESGRQSGGCGGGAQCSVCIGAVRPGEKVRRLPLCKHLYHVECIDMWLVSHTTSPICRAGVEPPGDGCKVAPAEQEQAPPV